MAVDLGVSENVVYPIVPNGFADHYPVFKWLAINGKIHPIFRQTPFRFFFPLEPEILEDPDAQAALAALAAKLLDIIGDGKSGAQVPFGTGHHDGMGRMSRIGRGQFMVKKLNFRDNLGITLGIT